jgi:hypothetical protein
MPYCNSVILNDELETTWNEVVVFSYIIKR